MSERIRQRNELIELRGERREEEETSVCYFYSVSPRIGRKEKKPTHLLLQTLYEWQDTHSKGAVCFTKKYSLFEENCACELISQPSSYWWWV